MRDMDWGWTVVCDFDGTISIKDATGALLERHATAEWREIESRWECGMIGSRECLALQVDCVRATSAELDDLASGIEIDPDFADFAQFCSDMGVPLAIVSDGIGQIIRRTLDRRGLSHLAVYANELERCGDDSYKLTFPYARSDCFSKAGNCKCAVIRRLRGGGAADKLLFVGDGRSDFCAAMYSADVVAAKSSLLRHLRSRSIPCFEYRSFGHVRRLLSYLLVDQIPFIAATEDRIHAYT